MADQDDWSAAWVFLQAETFPSQVVCRYVPRKHGQSVWLTGVKSSDDDNKKNLTYMRCQTARLFWG